MSVEQGADELRIAHQLRKNGVGPDAHPHPQPEQEQEQEKRVITPTRVIPAGAPLPGPSSPAPKAPRPAPQPQPAGAAPPPPPPPPPPASPAPPAAGDWWLRAAPPAPPAAPPPMDIHIHIDPSAWLPVEPEPEPGPPWWIRWRPGYQTACIIAGLPITDFWSGVLVFFRDDTTLTTAWVVAAIPLGITAMADNVYRIAAAGAHPDLWHPKIRAAGARILLWALALATLLSLPLTTVIYWITGVQK
ncbi:hypothetical protein ABT282_15975 [Streptomyces sp. NPDC000927]|uniref:hypothetical protein n=1 Tax=Streptomyces sp. NPDC000927 TaxID=3154371 RepID=UPI00332D5870